MARPEIGRKSGATIHLGRELRRRHFYSVEAAGAKVGWSRSEAYRQCARGNVPVVADGGLLLVPKRIWDRRVRKLVRGLRAAQPDEV
jgi:hypothetical protein